MPSSSICTDRAISSMPIRRSIAIRPRLPRKRFRPLADTRMTERHYGHLSEEYIARQVRENLPSFGFEADNVAGL